MKVIVVSRAGKEVVEGGVQVDGSVRAQAYTPVGLLLQARLG